MHKRDTIKKLVKTELAMQEYYNKLAELEKSFRKNTPEYQEILKDIKMVNEMKEKYFQEVGFDYLEKVLSLDCFQVVQAVVKELVIDDNSMTISNDEIKDQPIYQRIQTLFDRHYIDQIFYSGKKTKDNDSLVIEQFIMREIYSFVLTNFDLFIDDQQFREIRDSLIENKYTFLFCLKDIESYLFHSKKKNFIKILDLTYYAVEDIKMVQKQVVEQEIKYIILNLLQIKDQDFQDDYCLTSADLVTNIIFLKSIINIADRALTCSLYRQIYKKLLTNPEYQDSINSSKISIGVLKKTLNEQLEEKAKVYVKK